MTKVGSFLKGALLGAAAVVCCAQAAHADIPARYARLDWVECSGAQWVNTLYNPLCTDVFELKVLFTTLSDNQCLYCSRGLGTQANTLTAFILSGNLRFDRYGRLGTATFKAETGVDYTIVANAGSLACTANGEDVGVMPVAGDFTPGSPVTLLASHTRGMSLDEGSAMDNFAKYRFYHFRVYNASGALVREFVPVIDLESTDVRQCCGLFETQKGTFHPNLGTLPFKRAERPGEPALVLERDETWSEIGLARFGRQLDLNGHSLTLHAIDVPLAVTNSSETVADLHLNLADSVVNSMLDVQGNIRIVKEGAGTYATTFDNQLYTGGLVIREGEVQSTANGPNRRLGAEECVVTVEDGASIDLAGKFDFLGHTFLLNGGTLKSTATPASSWNKIMLTDVRLGADSVIDVTGNTYGFINQNYTPLTLDLGGHTLTVNANWFYFANTTTTAGTLVLNDAIEFYTNPSDFRASKTVVNGQLRVNKNCDAISLGDCEFNTPQADVSASYTGAIKVFGSLRPNTDFFHGCEMQDGSTLDLRGRSEPFRTKGRNIGTTDAMTTITFAPLASVTINVAGRELSAGMCLVEWNEPPLGSVEFKFDDATAALGFTPAATATGLYCSGAQNAYPAKAVWTGAAGTADLANAANWSCENFAGDVVPGALPGGATTVVFSGDVAPQVPPGASFPHSKMVFDGARLSADCDWRGLGAAKIEGALDLAGHTLRVAGLDGDGAITQAFDLTKPEPARASSSTAFYNGVAANLFSDNLERQVDSVHRVICVNTQLPIVVDYDFGEATLVTAYKIHVGPIGDSELQRAPKTWTFSGSDDGQAWTVLDERTDETGWVAWECRTFTFENETSYRFYRISITDSVNPENGYLEFVQLEYGLAAPPGTLRIEVPEGEVAMLNARVDGHVRLVKAGAGELIAKKTRQTYNMGTEIVEGNVRFGTGDAPLGRSTVKVGAGTRLDADTYYNLSYGVYNYDLAGTLAITNGVAINTLKFGNITLSGDATILGGPNTVYFSHNGVAAPPGVLALNGHTLTFESNGFVAIGQWCDDGSGGRLVLTGEGARFETTATGSYGPAGVDVVVTGGAILKGYNDLNIGGLTYDATAWQLHSTAFRLLVNGVFRPGAMYPALTMCNGSTLDLSQETGVWNADGVPAVAGTGNPRDYDEHGLVSFADGATVKVDVHGRTFNVGDMIVSWPARPAGAAFAFDDETAAAGVPAVAGETGLFYGNAGTVEVATWTGGAEDGDFANPANWACVDAAGTAVQNGLPHSGAIVRIAGSMSLQAPVSGVVRCAKVVFDNCTLAADCDLRGLDLSNAEGSIDLAGRKLYVSSIGGPLSISDARGYEFLGSLTVGAGAWVHTGYTPSCTDRVQAKVRFANVSGNKGVYCARTKAGNNFVQSFTCFAIGNKFRFDRNGGQVTCGLALNNTTDYEIEADGASLMATVNGGSAVTMTGGDFMPAGSFTLLSSYTTVPGTGIGNNFSGKFYYFKVFNKDGALMREYMPARRLSDGAVGMLETVQGTWLQNGSNSGSLTESDGVVGFYGTDPGELHIDVPEGVVVENHETAITGNIKLFKEGAGELVGYRQGQNYGGGTVVAAGTLSPRPAIAGTITYYGSDFYWGGIGAKVTVEAGATFDVAGQYGWRVYDFVLNGGTIVNSGPDQTTDGWGGFGNVTLTADSMMDLENSTAIRYLATGGTELDLGGHKLTVRLAKGKTFYLGESAKNGTIELVSGGWLKLHNVAKVDCSTVDLILRGGAALWVGVPMTVRSISMGATDEMSRGIYPITVLDTCRVESDSFYGCDLQPNTTLDLSAFSGELPVRCPFTWGCDSITYAPDSTVTLYLAGRNLRDGERIVAWETRPEGVTFVMDPESRSSTLSRIVVADDGIYVEKGLTIFIR
jgi:hypothetical protein